MEIVNLANVEIIEPEESERSEDSEERSTRNVTVSWEKRNSLLTNVARRLVIRMTPKKWREMESPVNFSFQ